MHTLNHRLRAEIQRAIAGIDDRVEQEVVGFETFFGFVQRHRNLYEVIRLAESVDEPVYRWHYETLAKGYMRGLRAGQAKGQIARDLDVEDTAYALMGTAEALGMRWVIWKRRQPDAASRRALRRMLERMLRPARARR